MKVIYILWVLVVSSYIIIFSWSQNKRQSFQVHFNCS